jgi:hypothetical protein
LLVLAESQATLNRFVMVRIHARQPSENGPLWNLIRSRLEWPANLNKGVDFRSGYAPCTGPCYRSAIPIFRLARKKDFANLVECPTEF